jgi:hypothetical protein
LAFEGIKTKCSLGAVSVTVLMELTVLGFELSRVATSLVVEYHEVAKHVYERKKTFAQVHWDVSCQRLVITWIQKHCTFTF